MKLSNVLFVLDSFEYKSIENKLKERIDKICIPEFIYTQYENKITKIFQKTKYIGSLLTHLSYWSLSFTYTIRIILSNKNSTIIFINPIVGFFYSLFYNFSVKKRNIHIAGFLFEPKQNRLYYSLRKILVYLAYRRVRNIIVYSKGELNYYQNLFPSLRNKFVFIHYGRNFEYRTNIEYQFHQNYFASGGRSNRDYQTLIKAMLLLDKTERNLYCKIATRPDCIDDRETPSNTEVKYGITLNQFGSFIKNSDFFVLPLLNNSISAGHMTLLEVMSIGKPILVTDIPAIRDYADERHVFFCKPYDEQDLANKILYLKNNMNCDELIVKGENAKNKYISNYTFDSLIYRLTKKCVK